MGLRRGLWESPSKYLLRGPWSPSPKVVQDVRTVASLEKRQATRCRDFPRKSYRRSRVGTSPVKKPDRQSRDPRHRLEVQIIRTQDVSREVQDNRLGSNVVRGQYQILKYDLKRKFLRTYRRQRIYLGLTDYINHRGKISIPSTPITPIILWTPVLRWFPFSFLIIW